MDMRGSYAIISDAPEPILITVKGPPPKNFLHYSSHDHILDPDGRRKFDDQFSFQSEDIGDYYLCISNGDEVSI